MMSADNVGPEARCCENCVFWRRHYIKIENSIKKFWPLDTGHCVNPERRMPRTKPKATCERFKGKEDEADAGGKEAEAQLA